MLVSLSNGIDRLLVVGDDVYKLIHETTDFRRVSMADRVKCAIVWSTKKLPKEAGDAVIAMLNLRER